MTLSTEDRLEILELAARYNQAWDGGEPEAWAETFTEDGVFGEEQGRAGLAEYARQRADGTHRHWINGPVIEGEGDAATMRSYLLLVRAAQPPELLIGGVYEDELRRVDGRWRFARRTVSFDGLET